MTKTEIAKALTSFVVGAATSTVVKEIVKNNTDPEKVADKAAVIIASYVLGAIAADASKKWTDSKIDEIVAKWMKLTSKDQLTAV